jgi:hypothetical protein
MSVGEADDGPEGVGGPPPLSLLLPRVAVVAVRLGGLKRPDPRRGASFGAKCRWWRSRYDGGTTCCPLQ